MRGSRALLLVRGVAATAIAAFGLGGASVAASTAAVAPATAAAVPVPFVVGHMYPNVRMSGPPTTAYCEKHYGVACYQPWQIQKAYNLAPLFHKGINGRGETIVIVDAFGSPSIKSDLRTFDSRFGLPNPPSFRVITPEGKITTTTKNCRNTYKRGKPDLCSDFDSWTVETSLDVEWSHSIAPEANILLVETPMTETEGVYGFPQIVAAENYVVRHHLGDVITQSFGANEATFTHPSQILALRYAYKNAERHHVTVLAAAGDDGSTDQICSPSNGCANPNNVICCTSGRAIDWPSSDPLVTAVGGTQLHLNGKGNRTAPDSVWNDPSTIAHVPGPVFTWGSGGGGLSAVFGRPGFQNGVKGTVGDSRGTPDIAMSAAVNGGVDFYDSTDGGWSFVGGTSEASPLFSGIVALADQVAKQSLGYLNPALYAMAEKGGKDGIVPITASKTNNNTYIFCQAADVNPKTDACASSSDLVTVPGFPATGTYSDSTGWGTVNAAVFVPALAHAAHHGRR
jgi:subtilase family serine protease